MYIKRRNYEHARLKRNNRKSKPNESFLSAFGTSFKVLAIWAIILMLDFFTDFRFEFLYSCWLFLRTVVDSFRYQGLAFALFFTLIAMTSDLICYFLIPATLVHLIGSSFVWVHLVWQADRGFYGPTVVLCFLFVYVEIAVRLRDPKALPLGIDICRPFAAHCIGYPAVTLGFVLKTMISHHFRMRKQRSVEAQNVTFFALLEEALPKELRVYLKSDEPPPKTKRSPLPAVESCTTFLGSNLTMANRGIGNRDKLTSSTRKQLSLCATNMVNNERCISPSVSSDLCVAPQDDRASSAPSDEPVQTLPPDLCRPSLPSPTPAPSAEYSEPSSTYKATETLETDKTTDKSPNDFSLCPTSTDAWSSELDLELAPTYSLHESSTSTSPGLVCVDLKHDIRFPSPKAPSSVSSTCSSSTSSSSSSQTVQRNIGGRGENSACRTRNSSKSVLSVECQTVNQVAAAANTGISNNSGGCNGGPSKVGTSNKLSSVGNSKASQKDEYTLKLESEVKQLKSELQSLRSLEIELRGQVQQLTAAERTYRSESSQARQEAEVLQTKLNHLTQKLEADQATLQTAEKRLTEERKQRAALEQQISAQQQPHTRQTGKGRKDLSSVAESTAIVQSKSANSKSVNGITQSTNASSPAECCNCGESCPVRLKELEAELRTLTRDLSSKEVQLAALKEARASTDQSTSTEERVSQSDHLDKNELLAKLQCLQEENQRMTDTLKEEDKMKQELMTAYHTALKEITELNSSLTKKEYQIVELNMRLESLTPQLCQYVNALSLSSKSQLPSLSISVDCSLDNQQSQYSSYLPDSVSHYDSITSSKDIIRRVLPDGHLYPDNRSTVQSPLNGCTLATYSESSSSCYTSPLYNQSFYDNATLRDLSSVHPISGDNFTVLENSIYSRFPNGCAHQNSDYVGSGGNFSCVENTLFGQNQPVQHSQHQSVFTRFPPRSTSSHLTVSQFDTLDGHAPMRHAPHHSTMVHSQSARFKSFISSPSGNRPLPVGGAAVSASSPPPCAAVIQPPGLVNRNAVNPSSYSRDFRRPHSSSQLGAASLEVVVTSAALLCTSAGLDLSTSGPSPPSLNSLIESLSPLGHSSHSPSSNNSTFNQFRCPPQNAFVTAATPDLAVGGSVLNSSDIHLPHFNVSSDNCPHYYCSQETALESDSLDQTDYGMDVELNNKSHFKTCRKSPPRAAPLPQQQQQQLDSACAVILGTEMRNVTPASSDADLLESSRS